MKTGCTLDLKTRRRWLNWLSAFFMSSKKWFLLTWFGLVELQIVVSSPLFNVSDLRLSRCWIGNRYDEVDVICIFEDYLPSHTAGPLPWPSVRQGLFGIPEWCWRSPLPKSNTLLYISYIQRWWSWKNIFIQLYTLSGNCNCATLSISSAQPASPCQTPLWNQQHSADCV